MFDEATWTLTYILADARTREAVIIDPVIEQRDRDLSVLREMGVTLKYILETHVHADHVTGGGALRRAAGAMFVAGEGTALECADVLLADGETLVFGDEVIHAMTTPGHTNGCMSYRWRDRLFTGDTLLIDACGRTDFQEGSPDKLYDSLQRLLAHPDETLIFPGHDYNGRRVSSVAQEKGVNPYVAGLDRAAFVARMEALDLPRPRRIDVAVPANRKCGDAA